jgi:hypothetical protein
MDMVLLYPAHTLPIGILRKTVGGQVIPAFVECIMLKQIFLLKGNHFELLKKNFTSLVQADQKHECDTMGSILFCRNL